MRQPIQTFTVGGIHYVFWLRFCDRGIIFLPFTTLMYVLVYNPVVGVVGWGWFWVILGFLLDISSYSSSAYSNRNRMPGYSS